MSSFVLSCLTYLCVALPGSTLGMLWPSMRLSLHEPVGALGIVLAIGVIASVVSSAATGRILARTRTGPLLAAGCALVAAALGAEALAPAFWLVMAGSAVFSAGFGVINAALNAHACVYFGARQVSWMHASYGLGATLGPLLVTALLAGGAGWRGAMASMSLAVAVTAVMLAAVRPRWQVPAAPRAERDRSASAERAGPPPGRAAILAVLAFTAAETGIESAAGIWGYVFLTAGRGLPAAVAGAVVSAYWVMMFAGRLLLGPVAERAGASRVLAMAVTGVPAGALLMAVPGPGFIAIAGMMAVGVAAAPVFPLLTLTTADRVGAGGTARTVAAQVAASAVGSAALPSGIGLVIGAVSARALGPALTALGVAMCGVYWLAVRPVRA